MSTLEATAVAMPSSNAFAAKFGGAKMQPVPAEAVVTPMEEARQVPRTAQISRRPSDGKKKVGFVGSNEVRFETKRMEIQSRIEAKFHSLPLPAPPLSSPALPAGGRRLRAHLQHGDAEDRERRPDAVLPGHARPRACRRVRGAAAVLAEPAQLRGHAAARGRRGPLPNASAI